MATYTIKQLCNDGPKFAMGMLLRCLSAGEPFITYGAIADELEYQLKIQKIFSTHIGHVAGSLMNRILEIDPDAPLINVLITRPDGIPGAGVGGYLADRYNNRRYRNWKKIKTSEKLDVVERERAKIFRYSKWKQLNRKLFGAGVISKIRIPIGSEVDGRSEDGKSRGGPAESDEHKRLKQWVADNAERIGLKKSFRIGKPESSLLSGDTIDVLFSDGNDYVAVEVKSCRSNNEDLQRGIYQCVKYRAVKEAEQAPNKVSVRALLVAERELNAELMNRARLLRVGFRCVSVNEQE
jgi:hypothetical protein